MYRLFVIAKNNMKKQKGDMFTFFILTFISAFLIFDCASAIMGLSNIMNDRFSAVNGAHILLYVGDDETESSSAEKAIKEDPHIIDYEMTPALRFDAEYRKAGDKEYSTFRFFAEDFNENKRIMKVETPDTALNENDILLPYNLKGRFATGDVMQIKFGDDVHDLRVAGYLEDPYFCSTINITAYYVGISGKMMDTLAAEHPMYVSKRTAHKGIADESCFTSSYTTADLEQEIAERYKDFLSAYPDENHTDYMLINWHMMRGGSQFLPIIVMAVILLFAILILAISLVIISFSIRNFIQRNMKNTGILEASGYTVKELRAALSIQILIVAGLGGLIGITVAMLTFTRFGQVVSSVLGLSWDQPVNISAAFITLIALLMVIALVSLAISSEYKKISVLDALRGGIDSHNFRKNLFSFEKTPLPLPVVLSLKDTFGGLGRNLLMVFISALLVIATLIGFGMVENFANDPKGLMKILAFETGTDLVMAEPSAGDISEDLRKLPGVKNVLINTGFEPMLIKGDKKSMIYTYAVDDLNNTQNTCLLNGRYPETDNEILVTSGVAGDLNVKTGDVVRIEYAGKEADYLITGINQRLERMGRTVYMRIDGAKKLVPGDMTSVYQYYVTADDGISYETLKDEISDYAEEKGIEVSQSDLYASMNSTIAGVTAALNAVCVVIAVITIIVVIFVESLVIRAKISRDWRGMGISKALGQTSSGLILQIMLSNLPAILTGAMIGGLLSPLAGGSLVKTAFSLFAIQKVDFSIPAVYILITVCGIILVAVLSSGTAGLKVRKLRPIEMITED